MGGNNSSWGKFRCTAGGWTRQETSCSISGTAATNTTATAAVATSATSTTTAQTTTAPPIPNSDAYLLKFNGKIYYKVDKSYGYKNCAMAFTSEASPYTIDSNGNISS